MKVIIAGSRGFKDKERLFFVMDNLRPLLNITEVITGGADTLGPYGLRREKYH